LPFCDTSLSLDARLDDILARMPLDEQIQQLAANSAGAPSVGLGVWSPGDFTHSAGEPLSQTYAFEAGGNIVYPAASALGQSFNRSLWVVVGDRIGAESRALYNAGYGALWGWSPNINIARDPRWGRINEVTGEDPFLMAEYAAVYVAAQQWGTAGAPNDTAGVPLRLADTCKHFAGYSLELWNGTDRHHFNAVSEWMLPSAAGSEQRHLLRAVAACPCPPRSPPQSTTRTSSSSTCRPSRRASQTAAGHP